MTTSDNAAAQQVTTAKRESVREFIDRKLSPHRAVSGVIAVGSVATGTARPDSDIDLVLFMDPLDLHLVPAEAIWDPATDTFHSIFAHGTEPGQGAEQFDIRRLDLGVWRRPEHLWPEPLKAELADGWLAYDRTGEVARLISERTAMPDQVRRDLLDESLPHIGDHLEPDTLERCWRTLGPLVAGDRLQAIYEKLVRALFACNQKWRPWRSREMATLLRLSWQPVGLEDRLLRAAIATGHDRAAFEDRASALRALFEDLVAHLVAEGLYGSDPISEAFIRFHDEPGRAWNMRQWNERHRSVAPPE